MNDFDERLRSRLRTLDAAVPTASTDVHAVRGAPTSRRAGGARVASRLPIGLAAGLVAVIAGAALLGITLRQQPGTEPAASTATTTASVPASASLITLGSDGIPTQIDGQRVYLIPEQAEWANLNGSFLLAAFLPSGAMPSCFLVPENTGAAGDLIAQFCGGLVLSSTTISGSDQPTFIYAAPKSSPYALLHSGGNHAAVLRVHTHDPEAAQCSADQRAACEAAVVVQAVVWPTVPSEINGEPVYRGSDGSFNSLSGSFLLGGVVSVTPNDWAPGACATPADLNAAGQGLLQACGPTEISIDMLAIAPASTFDAVDGQVVVVRAHLDDALAAQCPADLRTRCAEAIVVDSVVWSSPDLTPRQSLATPTPTPTTGPASTK